MVFARVLFDSASEINLIDRSFVKRNDLKINRKFGTDLVGIIDSTAVLDSSVELIAKSQFSNFELSFEANVINKIPYSIVNQFERVFELIPNLEYAEIKLPYNTVDILLGVQFVEKVFDEQLFFLVMKLGISPYRVH